MAIGRRRTKTKAKTEEAEEIKQEEQIITEEVKPVEETKQEEITTPIEEVEVEEAEQPKVTETKPKKVKPKMQSLSDFLY